MAEEDEPCSKRMRVGSIDGCLIFDLLNKIRGGAKILLQELLPSMDEAHKLKNWSLQLEYIDPYLNPDLKVLKPNIEKDLKTELVALCVWLRLSMSAPEDVKDGARRALEFIISSFDKDPYMSEDLSDEMTEEDLVVVEALCSKNTDVQEQVCCALHFSLYCFKYEGFEFGDGIQYKLIQLACSPESPDSIVACALRSIVYIASVRMSMKKIIANAEIKCNWLMKILMTVKDESALTFACLAGAYGSYSKCDDTLWMEARMLFMPRIIELSGSENLELKGAAACAISAAITSNASFDMIEKLVTVGCLKALFECAYHLLESLAIYKILDAISKILEAGDKSESESESESESKDENGDEDEDEVVKDNRYARKIDGYILGWVVLTYDRSFCEFAACFEAKRILRKYRPEYVDKYAGL